MSILSPDESECGLVIDSPFKSVPLLLLSALCLTHFEFVELDLRSLIHLLHLIDSRRQEALNRIEAREA